MKRLIAIAVLCVASMAMGAAADLDLIFTLQLDGTTIMSNIGDDDIAVGTFGFTSPEGLLTATSATGKFSSYIALPNGNTELSFITFGASAVMAPGESTNIGVMADSANSDTHYWFQGYINAEPEPVYYCELRPVPEPASMSMLTLGALALIRRRK